MLSVQELKSKNLWKVWNLEPGKDGRPTKTPYCAIRRHPANDTKHLATFEQATRATEEMNFTGVGVQLHEGLCGIDIDKLSDTEMLEVRNALDAGETPIQTRALQVYRLIKYVDSYTEITPSGKGFHILVMAEAEQHLTFNLINKLGVELEMYTDKNNRYFTWTGEKVYGDNIEDRQDRFRLFYEGFKQGRKGRDGKPNYKGIFDNLSETTNRLYFDGLNSEDSDRSSVIYKVCCEFANNLDEVDMIKEYLRESALTDYEKWNNNYSGDTWINHSIEKAFESRGEYKKKPGNIKEKLKGLLPGDNPPFIFLDGDKEKVSPPLLLAHYLAQTPTILEVYGENTKPYIYNGVYYKATSSIEVKARISELIREYDIKLWKSSTVDEVYKLFNMDLKNLIESEKLDADENLIGLLDGVLDIKYWTLRPHNADNLITRHLECNFKQGETATPVFDAYLADLCEGDKEKEQFLLQFLGCALSNVSGYKFKSFLILVGDGDTGKTIIKRLLEMLLGDGLYDNSDLAEIADDRFCTAGLHHKRVSGSNDMKNTKINEAGTIKQVAGGDSIRAQNKGEKAFAFVYKGFLFFVANNLPKFGGVHDKAVFSREIVIEAKNIIPEEKQNKKILEEMLTEKQGIIFKCLKAARKAICENGHRFDIPRSSETSKEKHIEENSLVQQFLNECTMSIEDKKFKSKDDFDNNTASKIWRAFTNWTSNNRAFTGMCRNNFEKEMSIILKTEVNRNKTKSIQGFVGKMYPVVFKDADSEKLSVTEM